MNLLNRFNMVIDEIFFIFGNICQHPWKKAKILEKTKAIFLTHILMFLQKLSGKKAKKLLGKKAKKKAKVLEKCQDPKIGLKKSRSWEISQGAVTLSKSEPRLGQALVRADIGQHTWRSEKGEHCMQKLISYRLFASQSECQPT